MTWQIEFTRTAVKQLKKLDSQVVESMRLLVQDLKHVGPIPGKGWRRYSKLRGMKNQDLRHCHLIVGKPTYVCCWEVIDKQTKLIEVYYVGTHEKAPY